MLLPAATLSRAPLIPTSACAMSMLTLYYRTQYNGGGPDPTWDATARVTVRYAVITLNPNSFFGCQNLSWSSMLQLLEIDIADEPLLVVSRLISASCAPACHSLPTTSLKPLA